MTHVPLGVITQRERWGKQRHDVGLWREQESLCYNKNSFSSSSFTKAMITSLKASSVQTAGRSHNQTDERAHMPIFPINLGTELCCEKRVGYYISPSKTSPGRQSGAQTWPVSPAHIWISLGSVTHCGDVDHTRYWLEEQAFLCPSVRIHTHTLGSGISMHWCRGL